MKSSAPARPPRRKNSAQFEAVVEILRAASRVRRSTTKLISPHGLTLSQYNALRILRGAPEGLSTMEVCERLLEPSPGITRIVDGLVKKEFVRRDPHPSDRRSILCKLTDVGLELVDALDDPIDRSDRDLLQDLTSAEAKQLTALLARVGNRDS